MAVYVQVYHKLSNQGLYARCKKKETKKSKHLLYHERKCTPSNAQHTRGPNVSRALFGLTRNPPLCLADVGADGDGHPGEAAPHGALLVLGLLGVQGGCPQVRRYGVIAVCYGVS